jgi:predicted DsbA family dithiol-disulfide isomerase
MTDRPPPTDQSRFIFASLPGAGSMLAKGLMSVNRPTSPPPRSVVRSFLRMIPRGLQAICISSLLSLVAGCGGAARPDVVAPGVPAFGPDDAQMLIVEFGDYQCGPCASMGRTLHTLLDEHQREVRFVFRHCPSRAHPIGRSAALVAAAASEDGRFWDLHWRLVADGPVTSEEQLWDIVADSGLDPDRLRSIVASGRPAATLNRDIAEADRLEVRGMPTTYIDGRVVEGTASLEHVRNILREELRSRHAGP